MFEQMKRAAVLLVGVAFFPGAWGQATLTQTAHNAKVFAPEYFGVPEGRLVQARSGGRSSGNRPTMVDITVGGADISGGNAADLTFTLTGATFAGRVPLSQFGSSSDHVSFQLSAGGDEGDNEVTVRVSVSGGGNLAMGERITFKLPDLQAAPVVVDAMADPPTRGVTVAASISVTRTTRTSFPDDVGGDPAVVYTLSGRTHAIILSLTNGVGHVALTDRKVLVGGTEEAPATLRIGRLSSYVRVSVKALAEQDSSTDGRISTADLPGDLVVTATGNFQTDDKVVIREAMRGGVEIMEMMRNEDGSFAGALDIETYATGDEMDILYTPGGVDDLLPGTFRTAVAVRYDDEKNVSGPVVGEGGSGRIEYQGISVAGYAYGIVKADGAAATYLRVACAGAADCNVFANCRDQSGESHFGELGMVPAGGLEVYDSDEIGETLGGGWEAGRGRCDLLSDGALEVQNMLRQGSVQVNNSVVISGGNSFASATSTEFVVRPVTILNRTQ